jgi:hypothetical protein
MRVFALRPSQPSARRVYQPAALLRNNAAYNRSCLPGIRRTKVAPCSLEERTDLVDDGVER